MFIETNTNEIKWKDNDGNSWRIRETELGLEIKTYGIWHILTTDVNGRLNLD